MKTFIYFSVAVALTLSLIAGLTLRWYAIKKSPLQSEKEEAFSVPKEQIKNADKNIDYFGTVIIKTKTVAGRWPFVEDVIAYDTLTVEQRGYFWVVH